MKDLEPWRVFEVGKTQFVPAYDYSKTKNPADVNTNGT